MSLTCSLLGHDFGDPEVEREREERGTEVVTSVREVSICQRCGKQRVISENTEVTSVLSPEDVEAEVDPEVGSEAGNEGEMDDPSATEAESETGGDEEPLHPNVDDPIDDEPIDDPEEEDDAVILTDDLSEREYGEWPAEPGQDYRPWDPDSLTEADDDESEPTVAEVVGEAGDAAGAGGANSDADRDPDRGEADGAEVVDAEAGESLSDADAPPEPPSEGAETYRCGECGYTVAAADTSLRAGDSCPACHEGYLAAERNH